MIAEFQKLLASDHFAFIKSDDMQRALTKEGALADWAYFSESWNHLPQDTYMADGGRYRQRRHAVFLAETNGPAVRQENQPHYQSRDRNPLNGGIQRNFEPIKDDITSGQTMTAILEFCHTLFAGLSPQTAAWHVEAHQFRIVAQAGVEARPTPEGMHRDGVDYVLVMLINRQSVNSGMTTVSDLDKRALGSFTLATPFDAALVDDRHVYHGVTPIVPAAEGVEGYRDVLVVTWVDQARVEKVSVE